MPSAEFLCYWVYRDDELFFYDIEAKEVTKYGTEKKCWVKSSLEELNLTELELKMIKEYAAIFLL